ncbi:hydrolase [Bacillus salacetis]|uniref:Hydrolase n=1 Tax=Bacillus salacetis TaxID=2315464 RepID=A0A3A1QYS4_9BACI|nr:SGNH/GDSL hydrolase family protein [Bacillus salacetis]RIW34250.1 hydrolase [Bacillus salacetis]
MESTKIVMIGDSITEWGRKEDPEDIGTGYVRLVNNYVVTAFPGKNIKVVNKGVGGDRITDMADRWEKDVLDEQPDYVSVSIGINDVWRQLDHPEMEQVSAQRFTDIYRELLTRVKSEVPSVKVILMEPTIIEEDTDSPGNKMLKEYVSAVHKLAEEFSAVVVPTHTAFIKYLETARRQELTTDGVHMNSKGNMLMAVEWVKAVKGLL